MSESIEIEFKSLLTQDEYQRLLNHYFPPSAPSIIQTNVYFDTPDFQLKKMQMGLRIRQLATRAELTLKSPLTTGDGLLETTDHMSVKEAEQLIEKRAILNDKSVAKKLMAAGIDSQTLVIHGQLTTKRFECQLTPSTLLVLDESWYHGKHDFELEMEVTNAQDGEAFFVNFLKENEIEYKIAKNKIVRTFKAKLSD